MPKSRKSSNKRKNPGVGIDFKKAKHKVGKKLPRAQNDTETEIKSGKIFLRESSIATDKSQLATTSRNNTLRELLSQAKHYSEKTRMKAINGLIELIREHPSEARPHAAEIIAATSGMASDPEKACRDAFVVFLRNALFPAIGEQSVQPFVAFLMAHICSAMTHLSAAVRDSGIEAMNVLLEFRPDLVGKGYFSEIAEHYIEALSRSNRGRSLTAGSLKNLTSICEGCHTFLRATLPHVGNEGVSGISPHALAESNKGIEGPHRGVSISRARGPVTVPILLNRQQCGWDRTFKQLDGFSSALKAQTPRNDQVSPHCPHASGGLGARLVALLLDCWEECGLVSEEDDIYTSGGMHVSSGNAKSTKGTAGEKGACHKSSRGTGERCGVAILQCCNLLIAKFKAECLSNESIAKIFQRVFPAYPGQTGCEVSAAAADLISTTISQLHASQRPFDETAVERLASWSEKCLKYDFSAGTRLSLMITSFASAELQGRLLHSVFDSWRQWETQDASTKTKGSFALSDAVMAKKNDGLKMVLALLEPPFEMSRLASLDESLALWAGEIPSLLWRAQAVASPMGAQYTFKLGLSVLLRASQFAGAEASRDFLPKLYQEFNELSIKIVPLFSLKIQGKVRPGPLTKMPESLQVLGVEVLHNLPGLDNSVVTAVHSALPTSSAPLSEGAIGRLLDLVFFKSESGDPQKIWSLIFSALEHGAGGEGDDRTYVLEHVSRIATHCSPPSVAINALVPGLLSKGTEPARCGALFFLRHCLTVFDDKALEIEEIILEKILDAISEGPTGVEFTTFWDSLCRDLVVRLIRQVPSSIPTIFSRLSNQVGASDSQTSSEIVAGHVVEALGVLDLKPDVRNSIDSSRALVHPTYKQVHDLLNILQ